MSAPRLVLLALLASTGLSGQEVVVRSSGQKFTFGDPLGVGVRSYTLVATEVTAVVPVRPAIALGMAAQYGTATMSPSGIGGASVSGLTDADFFALVRAGPLRIRGVYIAPSGRSTLSSEANVVAGLAAHEFLPFPLRGWGRGGGYALELTLPLQPRGFDVEIHGAVKSHGTFEPFQDDPLEYSLGSETRFGVRLGGSPTELSRIELDTELVLSAADEASGAKVFESGTRFSIGGLVAFPVGSSGWLARVDLYERAEGVSLDVAPPPFETPIVGTGDSSTRRLVALRWETRTPLRWAPLITATRGRLIRGEGDADHGWLASAGIGTELHLPGPWPGRVLAAPGARIHRGHYVVAEGYESDLAAWELSVTVRWEAPR